MLPSFQARENRPRLCVCVGVCVCVWEATLESSETVREGRICLRREVAGIGVCGSVFVFAVCEAAPVSPEPIRETRICLRTEMAVMQEY